MTQLPRMIRSSLPCLKRSSGAEKRSSSLSRMSTRCTRPRPLRHQKSPRYRRSIPSSRSEGRSTISMPATRSCSAWAHGSRARSSSWASQVRPSVTPDVYLPTSQTCVHAAETCGALRNADDVLLGKKEFKQVLEPLPVRVARTRAFLELFRPGIVHDLVPISDVYGPTGWDPNVQALVVSKETLSGAASSESPSPHD